MHFSGRAFGIRRNVGAASLIRVSLYGQAVANWRGCWILLLLSGITGCGLFEPAPDASKAITVSELLVDVDENGDPDLLNDTAVVKGRMDRAWGNEDSTTYLTGESRGVQLTGESIPTEGDSLVVEGTLVRDNGRLVFLVEASSVLQSPDAAEADSSESEDDVLREFRDSLVIGVVPAAVADLKNEFRSARSEGVNPSFYFFVILLVMGGSLLVLRSIRSKLQLPGSVRTSHTIPDAGEAILLTDRRFKVIEANPAALRLLGWTEDDARKRNLSTVLKLPVGDPPRTGDRSLAGVVMDVDVSFTPPSGAPIDLQLRVSRVDVDGQDHLLCLLMDITARQDRNQLMQRLQQVMLDEMPLEVAVLSPQGQYVFASAGLVADAAERKAIIGKTDVEVCREAGLHSEVAIRRRAQRRRTVASKQCVTFDETLATDAGERHFRRHYTPVLNGRGDVSMIIAYGVEETELRRLRREHADMSEEIERLRRMKDTFLQNLSHELRTPLTGILGAVQILRDEVTPHQRELLDIALRNGNRLLKTVSDVLDLASMQASGMHFNLIVLNVVEEVKEVVTLMHTAAEEKGLFLRVHAVQQEAWARLDSAGFRKALAQLLENAIKFTESGGIVVDVDADDERVHVRVMDSGVGIDNHYLSTLYDEFSQESAGLTRSHEGLGIGLALTERLIGMMGGTITANSEKADGSMFNIALPRAIARPASHQEERPYILVLERDRDEQRIFQYMLEPFCRVSFATDVERVLDRLSEGQCDGVLLNLDLCPDPAQLISQIRTLPGASRTLVVGASSQSVVSERSRFIALGLDELLAKPISKQALMNTLGSLPVLSPAHR